MKTTLLSTAALTAAIVGAFVHNKDADKLHVTPDGNCFLEESESYAKHHSGAIGQKYQTVERKDYAEAIEKELAARAKAKEEADAKAKADADKKAADKKAADEAAAKAAEEAGTKKTSDEGAGAGAGEGEGSPDDKKNKKK